MWGVAKIFTSGHSKGGSTEPPLATSMHIGLPLVTPDETVIVQLSRPWDKELKLINVNNLLDNMILGWTGILLGSTLQRHFLQQP